MEHFISVVGAFEDQIFQKRARLLQRQKQRRERDKANSGQPRQAGQGQAGSKWKAAVPNAAFTASLQPVGQQQSGSLLLPPLCHLKVFATAGSHSRSVALTARLAASGAALVMPCTLPLPGHARHVSIQ